ncbi:DUF3068 domain-containing protein [Spirillospora sp. CA-294931]|uniref:DUF3068 domain-containing protein n=1 Tax=Spirillospora sp. CA-294931 TaxID=3240042 RepID=UPI003D89F277
MRRQLGLISIASGAFFLSLAPLVKFYVADQVVLAPLNRYNLTRLEARGATYFDTATLKTRSGATLRATNTVRGDVRANNGDDDIAVWDSTTNIVDLDNPDKPIQVQGYRMAFDRRSSELVNCCGSNVDGDNSVRMTGYGLLWPLANVEKRDYPFFDMTTRQAQPMRFIAEDEVRGLPVYRFVQQIPKTKTASVDTRLPGSMLGLGAKSKPQKVDRYSEATISVWVDPRTGIPVKHQQNIHSTVQTPDGRGRMTVASARLVTIDADQKSLVDMTKGKAFQISAVRALIPVGSLLLGVILLLTGAIALVSARNHRPAPPEAPRRADGKFGDPSARPHVNHQ